MIHDTWCYNSDDYMIHDMRHDIYKGDPGRLRRAIVMIHAEYLRDKLIDDTRYWRMVLKNLIHNMGG
jgi:hypothetical protein